ncbi:hypothetical protein OEZ85_014185 [Tetradesmus obliquus]|uniref:Uncharacterized protein n=1 Tax=Tetradesmus obliquus TaxID=3088 RepID=A0ABY8U7H9_TETOB|nr:hypothetical protein OEZ85_014185 [Tetradesmus obliquus]
MMCVFESYEEAAMMMGGAAPEQTQFRASLEPDAAALHAVGGCGFTLAAGCSSMSTAAETEQLKQPGALFCTEAMAQAGGAGFGEAHPAHGAYALTPVLLSPAASDDSLGFSGLAASSITDSDWQEFEKEHDTGLGCVRAKVTSQAGLGEGGREEEEKRMKAEVDVVAVALLMRRLQQAEHLPLGVLSGFKEAVVGSLEMAAVTPSLQQAHSNLRVALAGCGVSDPSD